MVLRWHLIPASELWPQLWTPSGLRLQSISLNSFPRQPRLSRYIPPVPLPKSTPVEK